MSLYVDDCIIGGGTKSQRDSEVEKIFKLFPGRVLEPTKLDNGAMLYDINGIELEVKGRSYLLHMSRYIDKLLVNHHMQDAAPVKHPRINPDLVMKQTGSSDFPIRSVLGGLIWLSTTTRPDILYDVNLLARFVGRFGSTKGTASAAKKILKYLSGTKRKGLVYSPEREKAFQTKYRNIMQEQIGDNSLGVTERKLDDFSSKVFCFCDASFAVCPFTLRSQSGVCIYFRGSLIGYKSIKQGILTTSTCEAEYCASSDAFNFLETMGPALELFDPPPIPGQEPLLVPMFCDNQSAIRISRSEVLSTGSKHLKLRWLKVSEKCRQIFFCPTAEQEADAFTKSLSNSLFGMMSI